MESNILTMSKEIKEMVPILGELQEKMKGVNEAFSEFSVFKDSTAVIRENIKAIGEELGVLKKTNVFDIAVGVSSIGSFGIALVQVVKSTKKHMLKIATIFGKNDDIQKAVNKLGRDIGKGIAEGMKDSIATVKMATTVMCDKGIMAEFKAQMEINSPSKAMKRIASSIPEGIVDAIKDGQAGIKKAMSDTTDTIEDASKKMSKIKFGLGSLAAVTGLVLPLIDYFGDMMRTNETLGTKMEQIWAKITEAFKPVTDAVINLFGQFTTGSEGSVSALDTLLAAVNSTAVVLAGVIETIAGFFKEYGDEIVTIVKGVWSVISDLVSGAIDVFGGTFDVITGIFTGNGKKIKSGFKNIYEGIKDIFRGLTGFFSNLWGGIKSVFTKMGSTIGNGIGNAFKAVVNSILDFAENTINKFIRAINKAIGTINKIPGVEIGKLPTLNIPRLASGGLVSPGQLFVAREAGPELVGNFGARTAVMNNNQIVESVSRGVYAAVKEAMGSGSPITLNINNQLDGRSIGKQVIKYHNGVVKQTGYSPLLI